MNKPALTITQNQDDEPPSILAYLSFFQKAGLLGLILAIFALIIPLEVIAEDRPSVIRFNGSLADLPQQKPSEMEIPLISVQGNALVELTNPETIEQKESKILGQKTTISENSSFERWVLITAYSSTVDQCDSTPFITASGTHVHDGTIAANFLRFGTKVKFPTLYGDKIFIVEDRMKSNYKVDIWFPTRIEAINFGAKRATMEVIN